MIRVLRHLTLFSLAIFVFSQAVAQKANYTTRGGMTIGFGVGASYQQSDIANSSGAGFDFFLGSQVYKKEDAFLAVDWRFHFLAGQNMAHDHRINTDGTYSNIKYGFFNYDLEMGFTMNRLRERTRIVITGYAGAGLTHGRTFTDLYDADGNLYNYSIIDPNRDKSQVYDDLINLSDREYETALVNRAALMPTLGIFIGYQFSPGFSLGIEHKTNFSLNEKNSFAGIDIDNNIVTSSRKDRNHYTSVGFKWILGRRSSRSSSLPVGSSYPVPPIPDNFIDTTRHVTSTRTATTGRSITSTRTVTTTMPVTGTRTVNSTVKTADPVSTVTTTRTGNVVNPVVVSSQVKSPSPVVRFVKPASPVTVNQNIFGLEVRTENVTAWQDVTVKVNGLTTSNFSLSPEGLVTTNIGLKEGVNIIEVSGKNQSGVATETATITYTRPVTADTQVKPIVAPVIVAVTDAVVRPADTNIVKPVENPLVNPVVNPVVVPAVVPVVNPGTTVVAPGETNCGVRINPGNSAWQFCLVTPSGTFNRDNLASNSFSYTGSASSLFLMPVAGGGDAIVNGKPYNLKPGQYYLFTGSITVSVSTNNPGSMGQWSVCITASKVPQSGNGNNRPKSPCEVAQGDERPDRR